MNISERIKGVFFGQAVGDALGLATEFMSKVEVDKHYPDGVADYAQIVQDKHRSRWKPGQWTDDTDQWLCILKSIIEHQEVVPLDIASRLYQWMMNGGMGVGMSTYKVMSLPQYTLYPHKASELLWNMKKRDLAPNGALMRNSIVCIYRYHDLDSVLINCENIARLTHHDPRCIDSCKIMAHIIHGELMETPIMLDSLPDLLDNYDNRIPEYILPLSPDITTLHLDEASAVGYTLKALGAGLWAYFYAESYADGIQSIIMQGGDADTNACVAGSMLGAKFGYEAIPQNLVDNLRNHDDLMNYFEQFLSLLNVSE